MFSAENKVYPFSYHLPPPFSIPESDNNIFNNIQQPNHHSLNMLHDSYNYIPFLSNPPVPRSYPINNNIFPPNSTTNSSLEPSITQESNLINCPFVSSGSGSGSSKKRPGKKDRHTKISTAQGLRDRRVRLSINIAKEFFNLQDLLGFDKASKTLGWLLSKSKSAIDELVSSSNSKSSPSSTSHGEVVAPDVNGDEKKQEASAKKRKERRSAEGGNGDDIAREMRRVKARERARERTKQKKITTMVKDFQSGLSYHQRAQKNLMIQPSSSEVATQNNGSCYGICNQTQQGMVSVGDKSESRSSGSCLNFTCDQISSSRLDDQEIYINNHYYNNDYLMKLALESNDGFIRPPGFSALNIINLSTEIHVNGKPWENRGNDQILQ